MLSLAAGRSGHLVLRHMQVSLNPRHQYEKVKALS